jgi:hypothetical protein
MCAKFKSVYPHWEIQNIPLFLQDLQAAYVSTDISPVDEQFHSSTKGTQFERVAHTVLDGIPPEQLNSKLFSILNQLSDAVKRKVCDVVGSTPPSKLSLEQRIIGLCNLFEISYDTLTPDEIESLKQVVTTQSLEHLRRLFVATSDNGYEPLCYMNHKKQWTIVHLVCFMVTVQERMLRGFPDDIVPTENDYIQELQNSEHRLFVQIEMHKLYLICVERGIFSHTPSPPPSPPTSL